MLCAYELATQPMHGLACGCLSDLAQGLCIPCWGSMPSFRTCLLIQLDQFQKWSCTVMQFMRTMCAEQPILDHIHATVESVIHIWHRASAYPTEAACQLSELASSYSSINSRSDSVRTCNSRGPCAQNSQYWIKYMLRSDLSSIFGRGPLHTILKQHAKFQNLPPHTAQSTSN